MVHSKVLRFLTCLTRFKNKASSSLCSYVALHFLCQHYNTRLYSVSTPWSFAAPLKKRKPVYAKRIHLVPTGHEVWFPARSYLLPICL